MLHEKLKLKWKSFQSCPMTVCRTYLPMCDPSPWAVLRYLSRGAKSWHKHSANMLLRKERTSSLETPPVIKILHPLTLIGVHSSNHKRLVKLNPRVKSSILKREQLFSFFPRWSRDHKFTSHYSEVLRIRLKADSRHHAVILSPTSGHLQEELSQQFWQV